MVAHTSDVSDKRCGTCKWLDVPARDLTKELRTHKRVEYRMYHCRVPFTVPVFPESVYFKLQDDSRMMCPKYGKQCAFHEPRRKHE